MNKDLWRDLGWSCLAATGLLGVILLLLTLGQGGTHFIYRGF